MGHERTAADAHRTRRLSLTTGGWVALGLAAWAQAETAAQSPFPVDHLRRTVAVDGRLDDWPRPLPIQVLDPDAAPSQANTLSAAFGWQQARLCLAFRMQDQERLPAPPALDAYHFHLADSLQWYLDTQGNSLRQMDDDDLNFLLLPDGRAAVLRGDTLLAQVSQARVPQRETRALPFDYASRTDADGWQGEICIPAAALGRAGLAAGQHFKADLAINDWLQPVPVAGAPQEAGAELAHLLEATPGAPPDPALLAWSWRNGRDFGFPERWQVLTLVGAPPWWMRTEWRWPALILVLAVLLSMLAWSEWRGRRWRRQVQMLLRTWSVSPLPAVQRLDPPSDGEAVATGSGQVAAVPTPPVPRHQAFCDAVLAWVQNRLAEPLTPERLAQQFHVSLRTLQRRLREGLGTRPQDLILAVRLDAAQRFLRESRLRVSEIAMQCGFEDPAYFARRFREHFGRSPSEFREFGARSPND